MNYDLDMSGQEEIELWPRWSKHEFNGVLHLLK